MSVVQLFSCSVIFLLTKAVKCCLHKVFSLFVVILLCFKRTRKCCSFVPNYYQRCWFRVQFHRNFRDIHAFESFPFDCNLSQSYRLTTLLTSCIFIWNWWVFQLLNCNHLALIHIISAKKSHFQLFYFFL